MLMIRKVVVIKEWCVDESIEEIREEVHYLYLYDSPISQGQNYYSPQLLLVTLPVSLFDYTRIRCDRNLFQVY